MKFDREREAQGRLYAYARYKREILNYNAAAVGIVKKPDITGVHVDGIADPTGRGGAMLADPPRKIAVKMKWCTAIEDAWSECYTEDSANDRESRGLAYVMERYFCLSGER